MRGAVDPDRQPAHHGHPGARQHGAERTRVGEPVRGRRAVPTTPTRGRSSASGRSPSREQHRRVVLDAGVDRVVGRAGDQHARAAGAERALGVFEVEPHAPAPHELVRIAAQSAGAVAVVERVDRALGADRGHGVTRVRPHGRGGRAAAAASCGRARPARRRPRRAHRARRPARRGGSRHVLTEGRGEHHVLRLDGLGVGEVGDRARDPADARRAAAGEEAVVDREPPGVDAGAGEPGEPVDARGRDLAVPAPRRAAQPMRAGGRSRRRPARRRPPSTRRADPSRPGR